MLFLARMNVSFPVSMDFANRANFQSRDKEYSNKLQRRGTMKGIWRVVGEYANYSIFDVDDHDELHEVLSSFPMFPYMDVKITPLSKHPNATVDDFFATEA